ncbi:MAG: hypothetical protein M3Z66_16785, partial [Chloroflexota bacterium]|nr:hypothetical protein [Chloroflexota bacterium]
TLRVTDLKDHYDTQLALAAYVLLNVLTLTTDPATLLDCLRPRTQESLARALSRLDDAERRWKASSRAAESPKEPRRGSVMTYRELHDQTVQTLGRESVAEALENEWERWPVDMDKRERCVKLIERLWALSGRQGPAVVLFYAPPYYPHVAPTPSALRDATEAVVAAHPELNLMQGAYFPLLSDLSYLRLNKAAGLAVWQRNMPVWQEEVERPGGYYLPFDIIHELDIPIVNIGPYGRGVHQAGEAVLMSYSFGVMPQLIYETIQHLGRIAT